MRIHPLPLAAFVSALAYSQGSIQLLPPAFEEVVALSHDGRVALGYETISTGSGVFVTRGVVLESGGTPVLLDDAPGFDSSEPRAISADGQVIGGMVVSPSTFDRFPAKWNLAGDVTLLGNFLGVYDVRGMSDDGNYVVGSSSDRAARWGGNGDAELLGGLPAPQVSLAYDANDNGSVIVGDFRNSAGDVLPFRWVEGSGAVTIPLLPGHTNGTARLVSADGETVTGTSYVSIAAAAIVWRWTASGGTEAFPVSGSEPGRFRVSGANASLTRVAGHRTSVSPAEARPTILDVDRPVMSYLDFAAARQIPPIAGFTHYAPAAVSGDGHTLAGVAYDSMGGHVAWTASEGWDADIQTSTCMHGIPNQTGAASSLHMDGIAFAAANDIELRATDLPPGVTTFFLTSLSSAPPTTPPGSLGAICLGGSIGRYVGPGEIQTSDGLGTTFLRIDLTQTPSPVGPTAVLAGETWHYQAWHRDLSQGQATSNFTDAVNLMYL